MTSRVFVRDSVIKMGDYKFLSSPIVLGDSDIDLILRMDWLSKHKAQLDCAAREIQLTHLSEDVIIFANISWKTLFLSHAYIHMHGLY